MNQLFYGDNLDILRRHVADESVDLVYLDPPFQSGRDYNVLFERHDVTKAAAQIKAFEDTWRWSLEAERAYEEIVEAGGDLSRAMQAFRTLLGSSDMMAYLCMMAPRLVELRRVLKPTGSLYLHCDPTASHYLKLLLDSIFGATNFNNELVWKRSGAHGSARRYGPIHDTLLFYGAGGRHTWNPVFVPLPQDTIDDWYNNVEEGTGRRFNRESLLASGTRTGSSGKTWRGTNPTSKGRHWAIPGIARQLIGDVDTLEALDALDEAGRIFWPKKAGGSPMFIRYLDESRGVPVQDVITDIERLNNVSAERLGYPTQKPVDLLERLITASSNPGDVVLDPFCGCGTAIHAAQKLGRDWIGIDITCLATNLIKSRMKDAFALELGNATGEPVSIAEAKQLATEDRFQFQCWALGFVGARANDMKRGADRGIDGRLYFHLGDRGGETKQIVFSVKSGAVQVRDVRDLGHVVVREKAEIGVLITLEEPSRPMITEAAGVGFYQSPWGKHAKLQIITVQELLNGKRVDYPVGHYSNVTLRKAPAEKRKPQGEQTSLPGIASAPGRSKTKKRGAR